MDNQLWGKRIADRVRAGEIKIDEAIRSVMELVTELQTAQVDMKVSATATDASMTKLIESLGSLQVARTAIVSGHRRLEKLGNDVGVRTTNVGPDYKPPGHIETDQQLEQAFG
jgi:hypothetical protein